MFASLYFVQGAALAYFRNFHKPYLSRFGIDPDVIGLLSSILLVPAQAFLILAVANVAVVPVLWRLFNIAPQVAARPAEEEEALAPIIAR